MGMCNGPKLKSGTINMIIVFLSAEFGNFVKGANSIEFKYTNIRY